jgi:thymidylate synthase
MRNYLNILERVLKHGEPSDDRTGVGTLSCFGEVLDFDLTRSFPAPTTKTLAWKSVVSELKWFLSGSTNVNDLRQILHGSYTEGRTIWDDNYENQAKAMGYINGELGPVYGYQFHHENQLNNFIEGIKTNPKSRRHIITLWNPSDIEDMALPPCHGLVIQAYVSSDGYLDIQWYQRSVDVFLGLPFNIASYALFTHIIANICNLKPRRLRFVGGDVHIYKNHIEACKEQLSRQYRPAPTLYIPKHKDLDSYLMTPLNEFKLLNYNPHPTIKAPMAI